MILTIDIGNSTTKFGLFDGKKLVRKFSTATDRSLSAEELAGRIAPNLDHKISAAVASSVVPELETVYSETIKRLFDAETFFVDHRWDFGLKNLYVPAESLGIDRLIAASSAANKYGSPIIVCDFGTATTIDAVNSEGEYLGGVIAPGIDTFSEALFQKTSKLPRVEIAKPESIIGSTTVSAIQSGIFFGYIGLTNGILEKMLEELGEKPFVVATGGFSEIIGAECFLIEKIDENLVLEGLNILYKNNIR